jgi:hypothetical protein
MVRARHAALVALTGASLAAGLLTGPVAVAAEKPGTTPGWTTITESGGQTFSYREPAAGTSTVEAGGFDFTADFNARLWSRHYSTPNFGTHSITLGPAANCTRGETIQVDLLAVAWPGDKILGSRTLSCASGGSAVFTGISPDEFYFTLTASSFGVTPNRTLSGRANYP